MQFRSFYTLILCFIICANVDETFAKKRSDDFRRCLKQMKNGFRRHLMKLVQMQEEAQTPVAESEPLNETTTIQSEKEGNATAQGGALVLRADVSTEDDERFKVMSELQELLAEKVEKLPPGKVKLQLMEKFKKELARITKFLPMMINTTIGADAIIKEQNTLMEKVNQELDRLKNQERMYDPKQRRRIMEDIERENIQKEIKEIQEFLIGELESRSKLEFPQTIANQIWMQIANSTTLKTDLAASTVSLVESRDMLEEIKRTCRETKRIYEVDISAVIDLSNYLLQNVDVQIDLMTDVVRLMNHQPNLLAGTFEFHFTRGALDRKLVEKASAEIYEMMQSFAEMRKLHYKIKDYQWSRLANKTGLLFSQINGELSKQNQQFLVAA